MVAMHTAIAIAVVVLLIIKAKVDPIISLIVGCLYLGLAAGVGFAGTVKAITEGFGSIMASVGLLIGFGVLIGSLLHTTGTFRKIVQVLLRVFGPRRIPYALAMSLATIFPSIYVDVQVVLAAPVARQAAPHIGPKGLGLMAGALGTGIFCGYVFVVPGLSAISIAGLLKIPLGTYLLYGIVIGPLTALLTTLIFRSMLRFGWWNPATDEEQDEALRDMEANEGAPVAAAHVAEGHQAGTADAHRVGAADGRPVARDRAAEVEVAEVEDAPHGPPLAVSMLPIIVPLLMIAFGAFAELAGFTNDVIDFVGNANIALFTGLVGAYLLARRSVGKDRTDEAFSDGLHTSGEILLVTGIGGSLGAVIKATGLAKILGGLFSADAGAPIVLSILLAWFIAAVLHLAIGSVSVAAITGAGIIAPILSSIDVAPVAIGLAIASGALFALHVNSNFFWMFKSLLGLTTQGSLKTMTTVTTIASLVSLPLVMLVAVVS